MINTDENNTGIVLKKVFSVDTEAGHKLSYMITRALACPSFYREINLLPYTRNLNMLMNWSTTLEGHSYWHHINELIKRSRCG